MECVDIRNPQWVNSHPCPWLPQVDRVHDFSLTRRHGGEKGVRYFLDALSYAQSQWLDGKPAQAILQLDKAWMADWVDGELPPDGNDPYRALVWILRRSSTGGCGYLGNPVRHFQHLASRMSGPRAELRRWRAWLCLHLAERFLPAGQYPRDGVQIAREGLWIPGVACALGGLARLGRSREAAGVAAWIDPAGGDWSF